MKISSVPSSRNILHIMSVNTGLQMDKTVNTLFKKVSTDIPHIPKRLLNEMGLIWMQQEIIRIRLFVSFKHEIPLNIRTNRRVK
jgi:GTPase Era involved in 16S rRNA processing